MLGDGGNEVFGSRAGSLNVLGTDFKDFFEVHPDVGELALQEDDDLELHQNFHPQRCKCLWD